MFFFGLVPIVLGFVITCDSAVVAFAIAVGTAVGIAEYLGKKLNEHIEYVAVTEPKVKNKTGDENKKNEKKKQRNTKVGDLCPICLNKLTEDDFQKLDCGHALHADCYVDWHLLSYHDECVYCGYDIFEGDSICMEKLTEDDFKKLDCGHAIHADCHVARHRYSYHEECVYCGCNIFKGDSKKQK